jgi:hypothetical protein
MVHLSVVYGIVVATVLLPFVVFYTAVMISRSGWHVMLRSIHALRINLARLLTHLLL